MGMKKRLSLGCLSVLLLVGLAIGGYLASQLWFLPGPDEVSQELVDMYGADQADRFAGFDDPAGMVRLMAGDWVRVRRTRAIVAADLLETTEDFACAAQLLQHGNAPEDFRQSQALSLQAYELGDESMLYHSALAEDRYLVSIGSPQKYGTQFLCDSEDGWMLEDVDLTVTDADRTAVHANPLAIMEDKIAALNIHFNNQCSFNAEDIKAIEQIMEDEE